MSRTSKGGFEKYWTKYPYHFQEVHGVPATKTNIQEAYGRIIKRGINNMVQEWAEAVRDLSATQGKRESPTYSIGRQEE
jgi:hypothetical protein